MTVIKERKKERKKEILLLCTEKYDNYELIDR